MTSTGVTGEIRRASARDAPAVLAIFDDVIAWFVAIGNDGQWGRGPGRRNPADRARDRRLRAADAWVAEDQDGRVLGALILGESMPYVPPATEPEIYVRVLVASRDARGAGCRLAPDGLRGRARRAAGWRACGWTATAAGPARWCVSTSRAAMSEFHPSTWKVAGSCWASFVTVPDRSHAVRRLSVEAREGVPIVSR